MESVTRVKILRANSLRKGIVTWMHDQNNINAALWITCYQMNINVRVMVVLLYETKWLYALCSGEYVLRCRHQTVNSGGVESETLSTARLFIPFCEGWSNSRSFFLFLKSKQVSDSFPDGRYFAYDVKINRLKRKEFQFYFYPLSFVHR